MSPKYFLLPLLVAAASAWGAPTGDDIPPEIAALPVQRVAFTLSRDRLYDAWMADHCRVAWREVSDPWRLEREILGSGLILPSTGGRTRDPRPG